MVQGLTWIWSIDRRGCGREKTRLFSDRAEAYRLNIVRNRLANCVLAVLLMVQLVIGMQWQVAHANMDAPELQASGMDAQHCPDHSH